MNEKSISYSAYHDLNEDLKAHGQTNEVLVGHIKGVKVIIDGRKRSKLLASPREKDIGEITIEDYILRTKGHSGYHSERMKFGDRVIYFTAEANLLLKLGFEGNISKAIAEMFGYSESYIRECLPPTFKNSNMSRQICADNRAIYDSSEAPQESQPLGNRYVQQSNETKKLALEEYSNRVTDDFTRKDLKDCIYSIKSDLFTRLMEADKKYWKNYWNNPLIKDKQDPSQSRIVVPQSSMKVSNR